MQTTSTAPRRARAALSPDGPDEDGGEDAYRPPRSPGEDRPVPLALKVGLSMSLAHGAALAAGFQTTTWSVLAAAYLATSPPFATPVAAGKKLAAGAIGIALGVAGAFAAQILEGAVLVHMGLVGAVAGTLATRSPDYLFAAVVGTIVTFAGSAGGDPLAEVAVRTACLILIGCAVAPVVVFAVERVRRALWHRRRRRDRRRDRRDRGRAATSRTGG